MQQAREPEIEEISGKETCKRRIGKAEKERTEKGGKTSKPGS